jgi:cell division ATPase FtsA
VPELGGLVEEYRSPAYATVIGLLLEGARRANLGGPQGNSDARQGDKKHTDIIDKFKAWLKDEFF